MWAISIRPYTRREEAGYHVSIGNYICEIKIEWKLHKSLPWVNLRRNILKLQNSFMSGSLFEETL